MSTFVLSEEPVPVSAARALAELDSRVARTGVFGSRTVARARRALFERMTCRGGDEPSDAWNEASLEKTSGLEGGSGISELMREAVLPCLRRGLRGAVELAFS